MGLVEMAPQYLTLVGCAEEPVSVLHDSNDVAPGHDGEGKLQNNYLPTSTNFNKKVFIN